MTTSVTNTIIVIDNEGDSASFSQTSVISNTITYTVPTPASVTRTVVDPVSITKSDVVVSITRKTVDPVVITSSL